MTSLPSREDTQSERRAARDKDRLRRLADLLDPSATPSWTPREAAHVLCGVDPENDIESCIHTVTGEVLLRLLPGTEPPATIQDWIDLQGSLREDIDRLHQRLATIEGVGFMRPLDIVNEARKAGFTPAWWARWIDQHQATSETATDDVRSDTDAARDDVTVSLVSNVELARMGGEARARKYENLTRDIEHNVRRLIKADFRGFLKADGNINIAKLTAHLEDTIGNNPDTGKAYSGTAVRSRLKKALEKLVVPAQL